MDDFTRDLRDFVAELARLDPADVALDGPLFGSGIIDSLNLLELVAFVEKRRGIHVSAGDLTLDNWNTLQSIESFVTRMTRP